MENSFLNEAEIEAIIFTKKAIFVTFFFHFLFFFSSPMLECTHSNSLRCTNRILPPLKIKAQSPSTQYSSRRASGSKMSGQTPESTFLHRKNTFNCKRISTVLKILSRGFSRKKIAAHKKFTKINVLSKFFRFRTENPAKYYLGI